MIFYKEKSSSKKEGKSGFPGNIDNIIISGPDGHKVIVSLKMLSYWI